MDWKFRPIHKHILFARVTMEVNECQNLLAGLFAIMNQLLY
jgi:hypothetical protein